ncbi:MAG: CDP-diacylglycerol--serine O-phosphatidyltransferase [Thermoanaerobaculia bacterium]
MVTEGPLGSDDSQPVPVAAPRRGVRRGIYVLPTLFTLGNIFCGYLSIDSAVNHRFDQAAMLLFLAGVLDGLDGRVARLTGTTSAFGEQLDSLADVISFGFAPAFLVYLWALSDFGRLGLFVSFLFVVCGACRLARFNVQVHIVDKRFFVGLPIPSAAGALVGLIWVLPEPLPSREAKAAFLVITCILSWLMISTLRYRSFKDVDLKSRRPAWLVPLFALVLVFLALLQERALTTLLVVYALSAPVTKIITSIAAYRRRQPVT